MKGEQIKELMDGVGEEQLLRLARVEKLIHLYEDLGQDVAKLEETLEEILRGRVEALESSGIDVAPIRSTRDLFIKSMRNAMQHVKLAQAKEFQ